jgi:hypothetical protein
MSKEKTLYKEYNLRFPRHNIADTSLEDSVQGLLCHYVLPEYAVLDMGSGWGSSSTISMQLVNMRWILIRREIRLHGDVHFLQQDCSQEWDIPENSLDIVLVIF